ncbi:hypothetical protein [Roseateles sp.]|uniref:hypothetical protein n=1 Tax=Roseateles sp. TaxID=1971397 RepID=UPI0031CEC9CE
MSTQGMTASSTASICSERHSSPHRSVKCQASSTPKSPGSPAMTCSNSAIVGASRSWALQGSSA